MDKLILLNKYILKLVILYESKWVSEEVSKFLNEQWSSE